MEHTRFLLTLRAAILPLLVGAALGAADLKPIKLSPPRMAGGMPLMEALKNRKSSRRFSPKSLPVDVLSQLLWAARGVNRPGSGRLTAPTAMNWQEIDVYVSLEQGLYLYDAKGHTLQPVLGSDIRAKTGLQDFVADAPVNLVFVADLAKMRRGRPNAGQKDFYAATDTGYISQNVYLYCASEGLATVVRGLVDKKALAKTMGLKATQKVVLTQTVGYPAE